METIVNSNKLDKAENLINNISNNTNIKRVKSEKGLIEKTEASKDKVILVEDNRQIICG